MLKWVRGRLRNKFAVVLIVFILIPMAIVTAIAVSSVARELDRELIERADKSVELVQGLLLDSEEELLTFCGIMASDSGLKVDLSLGNFDFLNDFLSKKQSLYKVDGIFLADARGSMAAKTGSPYASQETLPSVDLLKEGGISKTVSGLEFKSGDLRILTACPVAIEGDELLGFVELVRLVDEDILKKIKRTTGTEISIFFGQRIIETTLSSEAAKQLRAQILSGAEQDADIKTKFFISRIISLRGLDETRIGTMVISVPRAPSRILQARIANGIIMVSVITLIIAMLISVALARRITHPIAELVTAIQRMAQGDLGQQVIVKSRDEIAELANGFNHMASGLKQLVDKEKEVAALSATADVERKKSAELSKAYEDLKKAQSMLIEAEKLQSVGRLAAGVAHEVKNPLAILMQGLEFLLHKMKGKDDEIYAISGDLLQAVKRADHVIRGLVDFSAPHKLQIKKQSVNTAIEQALFLVKHEFDKSRVDIVKEFSEDLPDVLIDQNKIQQVFINLLTNAAHAMEEGGTVTLKTFAAQLTGRESYLVGEARARFKKGERVVVIEVSDTGSGIPQERIARVFDPFFTTKPTGKGTGLGLSVTRKIVEMHDGLIHMANRQEGGLRVIVALKT